VAKPTKREQIIQKLTEAGYREGTTASRKYLMFIPPRGQDHKQTLWVGKAGAVRVGRTIAESFSITDGFCAQMGITSAGREALAAAEREAPDAEAH